MTLTTSVLLLALFALILLTVIRELQRKQSCQRQLKQQKAEFQKKLLQTHQELDEKRLETLTLGQYLLNFSEQLRSPLQVLNEAEQWLERPAGEMETGMRQLRLANATSEMQALVEHGLALSLRQSGEPTLHNQSVNLQDVLLKIRQSLHTSFARRSVNFTIKLASNIPEQVVMDRQRLMQILLNLVGQLADEDFTGNIDIMLKQLARENNISKVLFSVSESSQSNAGRKQISMFEQGNFEQVDISGIDSASPGLAISQRLVTLMGGHLRLERHERLGQRFYFSIPIKLADQPVSGKAAEQNAEASVLAEDYPLKKIAVLLATGNRQRRLELSKLLTARGATVDSVENGRQAIQAVLHGQYVYDALILDLDMAQLNGLQTATEIRDVLQLRDLPILALDAKKDEDRQALSLEAGMNAYLSMPVDEQQLIQSLAEYRF